MAVHEEASDYILGTGLYVGGGAVAYSPKDKWVYKNKRAAAVKSEVQLKDFDQRKGSSPVS